MEVAILKIKESIDVVAFVEAAKQCGGAVFLQTADGDITNLKSLLSQYVLMAMMYNPELLTNAQVICIQEEDYQKLEEFLVPWE